MTADLFATALRRAEIGELPAIELMGLAERLREHGALDLAVQLYRAWIGRNSGDPLLYATWFNCAALLSSNHDLVAAREALGEAIRLNPGFMPPHINLGLVHERLGARAEAVAAWLHVSQHLHSVTGEALAHKKNALKQLGRVLEGAHFDPNAEHTLRQSLDIDPHQRDVLQHWLSLRQRQCEWPVIEPWGELGRTQLLAGLSPLSLAAYTDDPLLQLANAARFSKLDVPRPARSLVNTHDHLLAGGNDGKLRIGYLSSDLREHAVGLLMVDLFEQHDPAAVEVFVYYCGHAAEDAIHRRIKAAAPHWTDISAMTDEQAAAAIVADNIAVLVDVNGYTHGARSALLAMRPAPVLVNWLGYPGTTGSPDHHYILADNFIIPPGSEIFYSEKVARLPCYQPNDRRRAVSDHRLSPSEAGLPEDAVVYCCFNGAHKFTPFTWRRWMTILQRVPGSVLWLLAGVPTTDDRLRVLAARQGLDPQRLIFAPRLSNPDHLARYHLADLFLDTSPYGAHTTASDALWMGVPVLTLAGRSFASRVCGSLVTSAGIPELVCHTADDYVAIAVSLGQAPARLLELRRRLRDQRDSCVLFDTPALARRLEALFAGMWREAVRGRTPRPDLSNLDLYEEIGATLDQDDREMLTVPDYRGLYREKLAERDSVCCIRPDARLWPADPAGGSIGGNSRDVPEQAAQYSLHLAD